MDMKTVSVAVLKQQLSYYLHQVEEGQEVLVTAHRRPVARVTSAASGHLRVRMPTSKISVLRELKGVTLLPGRTAVDLLIEDRASR